MDFDTGSSGSGAPPPRPPSGRMSSSGGGSEFSLQDPVGTFIPTVRAVLLSPASFFRGIRKSGDFAGPLVFSVICALVYGLIAGILALIIGLINGDIGAAIGSFFGSLIGGPIGTLIGVFIGAAIYHLFVLLLAGQTKSGFEATFRVVAYGSALLLISWLTIIPILGIIVALVVLVYGAYIYIMGIREVHSTTTGRAAAVVLIPTAILVLIALLFVGAILVAIFAGSQQM